MKILNKEEPMTEFNPKKILGLGILVIILISLLSLVGMIFENVDAKEVVVIQYPITGTLRWYTTPGFAQQWFGTVTRYPKRNIYRFEVAEWDEREVEVEEHGKKITKKIKFPKEDHRINVMFNDNGQGLIAGTYQYDMPVDAKNLTELHTKYGSPEAIQHQLIKTVIMKSIYMTGPMISSR